ncbi:MAG TPA: PQQ-binding-like beta-propeller repeat protein, partial [Micromonosporaceae bacterium]
MAYPVNALDEPLVDLGDDFDPPAEVAAIAPAWRDRRTPRVVGLALLVLLLVAGSASVASGPFRVVARIVIGLDASVMVEGPNVYVYDISDGHDSLRAYRIDGGRLLWSAVTVELAPETTMAYVDGYVIASMSDTDNSGEHTVAFDARTGRRLWTSEFGYATAVTGGVLVESAPRPAGFNYPGTVRSATYRLLNTADGRTVWSLGLPDDCDTALANDVVPPEDAAEPTPTTLIELCPDSKLLTTIDLATGRTTGSRTVDLGDPADNFTLPPPDQMAEPQLTVAGDMLLVAHASAPQPSIDAYRIRDLAKLWSGLPMVEGQDVDQCGTSLCVYDGASDGSVFDLHTGKQVGLISPRQVPPPPNGQYELVAVGQPLVYSLGAVLSSTAAGVGTQVPT